MPSRPPPLKAPAISPRLISNWSRKSRQERGYGRAHELMREKVLEEEPVCRMCLGKNPPRYSPSTIADHKVPKAEGGTDERENYQGLCASCSRTKTAQEAKRGARRAGRSRSGSARSL